MHGPGYAQTEAVWNANHQREHLTLIEAIEACGKCHRLAPFCNYNGVTFMTIIRDSIAQFTGSPLSGLGCGARRTRDRRRSARLSHNSRAA